MTKIKIYTLLILIVISCLFASEVYQLEKRHKRNILELETELQKKQDLIDSQVRMLIDIKDHCEKCDCEWLQSFYDEFHEEVGAFE